MYNDYACGCSLVVKYELPKLGLWVRFPSSAPNRGNMSKLFIYYSHTGNGELIAEKMAGYGYETYRVIPKKDIPNSFFWGIMTGGFWTVINKKPKLKDFNVDLSKYDEVVIGAAIWNARLCCPIVSALEKLDLKDKKLSFILYSGSGEAPNAEELINQKYGAPIIKLQEPKKYPEVIDEKLKAFN